MVLRSSLYFDLDPAQISRSADVKTAGKRRWDGLQVQSLRPQLVHLGSLALGDVALPQDDQHAFPPLSKTTRWRAKGAGK